MDIGEISGYHIHIYYHGDDAMWLGQTLPIDFDAVRSFMEERLRRERA